VGRIFDSPAQLLILLFMLAVFAAVVVGVVLGIVALAKSVSRR
jgi:hypothetical protein